MRFERIQDMDAMTCNVLIKTSLHSKSVIMMNVYNDGTHVF